MRPPPPFIVDPDVIAGCIEGHRASMEAMYRACLPALWPIAMRYARDEADARDIFNTAMLKIFRALPQFQGDNLSGWMRTILIHTGIDAIRSRNRQVFTEEMTPEVEKRLPETLIEDQFAEEDIMRALQGLPEPFRIVLLLYAIEGYSHAEIAEQLGITPNNSRWRLNQARQQMKTLLLNLAIVL